MWVAREKRLALNPSDGCVDVNQTKDLNDDILLLIKHVTNCATIAIVAQLVMYFLYSYDTFFCIVKIIELAPLYV